MKDDFYDDAIDIGYPGYDRPLPGQPKLLPPLAINVRRLVVAGNHRQFLGWCDWHGINMHLKYNARHNVFPRPNLENLHGITFGQVWFVGTHHEWGGPRAWEARAQLWHMIERNKSINKQMTIHYEEEWGGAGYV